MIIDLFDIFKNLYSINPISQSFWLIGLLFMIVWLYQKDENKLKYITWFWLASFSIHFLLMWLYIAALINFIAISRNLISIKYKNSLNAWLIMSVVYLATLSFDYTIIDLLIIWAALIVNYWYFMLEWIKFRTVILWSSIIWLIYWIMFYSVWAIISNIILWTTIIISIIRLLLEKYPNILNFNKNIYYIPNTNFSTIKIKD